MKVLEFLVLVDFVVLDMHPDSRVSLILGRPFLSTANARINVGAGEIIFKLNGKEERFAFKLKSALNSTANMISREKEPSSPEPEIAPEN